MTTPSTPNKAPSNDRRSLLLGAVAGTAAVVGGGLWFSTRETSGESAAPAIAYTLLDGKQHRSESWSGKVVLVNFWATSCTTCVAEMPKLVQTHEQFKARGYETLAVAMQYDPPAYVARFAESRRLPFGVAIDNTGAIARAYGDVKITPTTFLIDKKGRIVKRYVGEPDFKALAALIERLLSATA